MQVVCTPLHLLALNLVNVPAASAAARVAALRASTPRSARFPRQVASNAPGVRSRRIAQRRRDGEGSGRRRRRLRGAFLQTSGTRDGYDVVRSVRAENVRGGSGVVERGGFQRRRSVAGAPAGAARVSLPGPTRVPPKFANITHATGVAAVPIQTTVQVTEVEDAARGGRGTVAEGWAGPRGRFRRRKSSAGARGVAQNICAPWARWADARRANGAGG